MTVRIRLGWILVVTGLLFLLCGLIVTIFATVPQMANSPMGEVPAASVWVDLANGMMRFIVEMMAVDWTPSRVGVFFIIVGMILEGTGAYALISGTEPIKV